MKSEIKVLVGKIFADLPDTAKNTEMKEEIFQNLCDRYDDLISSGKSDYEAMESLKNSIGDFSTALGEESFRNNFAAGAFADTKESQAAHKASADDTNNANSYRTPPGGNAGNNDAPQREPVNVFSGDKGSRGGERRDVPQNNNNKKRKSANGWVVALAAVSGALFILLLLAVVAMFRYDVPFSWADEFFDAYRYSEYESYSRGTLADGGSNADIADSSIQKIDISWLSGSVDIELVFDDGDTIRLVETSKHDITTERAMRYRVKGGVLYIKFSKPIKIWDMMFKRNYGKSLTVYIPNSLMTIYDEITISTVSAGVYADFYGVDEDFTVEYMNISTVSGAVTLRNVPAVKSAGVYTVSGDIQFSDIGAINKLRFDTVSGNIGLKNCEVGSELIVESVSGDIKINDCGAAYLKFNTVSGDVEFTGSVAKINGDTVSGNVLISTPSADDIDIESVSGDIELLLYDCSGFVIDYDTVSGDYENSYPATTGKNGYSAGDGSCAIRIDTVSGDLYVSDRQY